MQRRLPEVYIRLGMDGSGETVTGRGRSLPRSVQSLNYNVGTAADVSRSSPRHIVCKTLERKISLLMRYQFLAMMRTVRALGESDSAHVLFACRTFNESL